MLLRRTYEEGRAGLGAGVVATSTGNGWHGFRDIDSGKVDARADLSKAGAIVLEIQSGADGHPLLISIAAHCYGPVLKHYWQPLPRVMTLTNCMALST
jgi:hypothetical protein